MKRARGYIRLSEEDKNNPSESPENQKKLIMAFCVQRGYDFQKFYEDIDIKGWWKLDKRPALKQAFNEVKEYDILIVKNWSRFARKGTIQDGLIELFLENGVKIIPISDATDKKARQVIGLSNEWLIDDLRRGAYDLIKNKLKESSIITRPPFGYYLKKKILNGKLIISPKKFMVNKKEAEIVRNIFAMKINGIGEIEIGQETGLSQPRINGILKNVTYIGYHKYTQSKDPEEGTKIKNPKTIIYRGKHQPIIDLESFRKVNPDFKLLKSVET